MSKQCPRSWEVEAVRDGRIAAERARVERHVARCADCAREACALDGLGRALRSLPSAKPNELSVRRRRQALLGAANAAGEGSPRAPMPRRVFLVAGFAAAVLLVFLGTRARFHGNVEPSPSASAAPPAFDVRGEDGAVFLRATEGDLERVVISHGRVAFTVRRRDGTPRLLVQTPDAEIEDIGTAFSVLVEGGKTTEVRVSEGRVLVRLRGARAEIVEAGSTWRAPAPQEASVVANPVVEVSPPAASAFGTSKTERPPSRARPHASAPLSGISRPDDAAAPSIEPAMAAYRAGEYGHAATLFEQFEREFPNDARTEDAAYLRVIALLRAGDEKAARVAARAYLEKHTSGFRAQEVSRIAGPSD